MIMLTTRSSHAVRMLAIMGPCCMASLALLRALDPSNPKSNFTLDADAAKSGLIMGAMQLGLVVFCVARVRPPDSSTCRDRDSIQTRAIDQSWRARLRAHDPSHLRPAIAWPTLALLAASLLAWAWAAWAGHHGRIDAPSACFLCAAAIFVSFTPMHDATHCSVVRSSKLVNDLIGLLASVPFMCQYRMFKKIHLAHHANLNHPSLDPDHWAGSGHVVFLPLRWASVFFNYGSYALEQSVQGSVQWRWLFDVDLVAGTTAYSTTLWWFFEMDAVLYWLIPFVCASTYLMYVFDYLPHRPHRATDDPYVGTAVTTGAPSWLLTALLLSQNMHNVHHLAPSVPFYRYGAVWRTCREELLRRGTRELPWVLWPTREAHLPELREHVAKAKHRELAASSARRRTTSSPARRAR